jgi:Lipocalin-like domain
VKHVLVAMLAFFSGLVVQAQNPPESLTGTWRLVSQESRAIGGGVTYPFGRTPLGMLMYDGNGHVSAQLMKMDLPRFASGDRLRGSDAEVRAVVEGSASYYGKYTIDPSTRRITHHIVGSSFPSWNGTDQCGTTRSRGES